MQDHVQCVEWVRNCTAKQNSTSAPCQWVMPVSSRWLIRPLPAYDNRSVDTPLTRTVSHLLLKTRPSPGEPLFTYVFFALCAVVIYSDDQTVTHEPAATTVMMMMMPLLSALATAAHCRCTRILRHTCGATTEQRTSPPTHAADAAKVPVARDDAGCRGTIVPYRARLAAATGTIVIVIAAVKDLVAEVAVAVVAVVAVVIAMIVGMDRWPNIFIPIFPSRYETHALWTFLIFFSEPSLTSWSSSAGPLIYAQLRHTSLP